MTRIVQADLIEQIVGVARHPSLHYAMASTDDEMVYILHSSECLAEDRGLQKCRYSLALDRGILMADWDGFLDAPVTVRITDGRLIPSFNLVEFRTCKHCGKRVEQSGDGTWLHWPTPYGDYRDEEKYSQCRISAEPLEDGSDGH